MKLCYQWFKSKSFPNVDFHACDQTCSLNTGYCKIPELCNDYSQPTSTRVIVSRILGKHGQASFISFMNAKQNKACPWHFTNPKGFHFYIQACFLRQLNSPVFNWQMWVGKALNKCTAFDIFSLYFEGTWTLRLLTEKNFKCIRFEGTYILHLYACLILINTRLIH